MRKAQTTIETMMAVGVILVFVLMLYNFVIYPRMQQSNYAQTYYLAKSTCSDLSTAIKAVAFNENGFNERIRLPEKLYGTAYTITVYPTVLDLKWDKGDVYCPYTAKNVSYLGTKPPFNLPPGGYVLNNSKGDVTIA